MAGSSSRNSMTSGNLPTSATVYDFICLFTHDLKRKQKRWQDGVLKYHTFNKRIMVHDDRGHFIGDAHWQSECDLGEGDEFELDRGSAIVQVSDCAGQREQDLTELLDKRAKDVERRRASANARTPIPSAAAITPGRQDQSAHFQLRHRPLSVMLGTPSRIGRAAIPLHSPFEARQMAQKTGQAEQGGQTEESRPSKRIKHDISPISKPSHARSLFGQTLTLSARPTSTPVARSQALRDTTNVEPRIQLMGSKDMPISLTATPSGLPKDSHPSSIEAARPSEDGKKPRSNRPPTAARLKSTRLPRVPALSPTSERHEERHNTPARSGSLGNPEDSALPLEEIVEEAFSPAAESRHATTARKLQCLQDPARVLKERHHANTVQKQKSPGLVVERPTIRPEVKLNMERRVEEPVRQNTEPRTELRIKSRQRRGLLMMSEKVNLNQRALPESSTHELARPKTNQELDDSRPPPRHLQKTSASTVTSSKHCTSPPLDKQSRVEILDKETATGDSNDDVMRDDNPVLSEEDNQEPANAVDIIMESDNDSLEDDVARNDSASVSQEDPQDPSNVVEVVMESDNDAVDNDVARTVAKDTSPRRLRSGYGGSRLQKRARRVLSSDDESESSALESSTKPPQTASRSCKAGKKTSSSGPRITRMARKSVKSREIIGFVIPSDDHVFAAPIPTAKSRAGETRDKSASVTTAALVLHTEERQDAPVQPTSVAKIPLSIANTDPVDRSEMRPAPRLSNPATRGKKAAKREDAAGQTSKTIVQLDPVAPLRSAAPKVQLPNKGLSLPGFARANGGAWSRHAEDLLGMTRPTRKSARQQ
ncbi:Fc.00g035580.m01.CDS01 [Cosmosporella sp. VM-42]